MCTYGELPVCPYCGNTYEEYYALDLKDDGDIGIADCPRCGNTFRIVLFKEVRYETHRINPIKGGIEDV